jgi:sugar phosphate isomerase/epimerase
MKALKALSSLLLVAAIICSCQPAGTASKVEKKDIGIQLYSVRDTISKDFSGTIKAVGEMGYTYIEAAGYKDGKLYDMAPEDFKKAIEAAGMKVLSSHVTHPLVPANADSIKWDDVWKWWDQCIAANKAAGAKYLINAWMPAPKTLDELKLYCDYYNKIGEKCKAQGIQFGYHNHDFEFGKVEVGKTADGKPELETIYDYMLKNTDPNLVIFEMDVYWIMRGGQSSVEYFNKYPGRFQLLHIKDEKELGQSGMVGFDAIFNNIDKAGTKYIIVEVERYGDNLTPLQSTKQSLDYLQSNSFVKKSYDK